MKKITTRQLLEAEKSGRKLAAAEDKQMKMFKAAIKPLSDAVRSQIKGLLIDGDKIKEAFISIRNNANNPLYKYEGLVYKEKGLNLKDEIDQFIEHLMKKYEDLTLSELNKLSKQILEQDFFEWITEIEKNAKEQLRRLSMPERELTQRQKAIVLYFKQEAELIPRLTRPILLNNENGSAKLYNMLLQVSKGKYKLDDLEIAIEFLTEFPAAHKLATEASKKS